MKTLEQAMEMVKGMELVLSGEDFDVYEGNGQRVEVDFDAMTGRDILAVYVIDEDNEVVEIIYEAE